MNEQYVTKRIVDALSAVSKDLIVLKHCDRVTRAVPDISVTTPRGTWWLEVKLIKAGAKLSYKEFRPDQLSLAVRLDVGGRCRYVVAEHAAARVVRIYAVRPADILRCLRDGEGYAPSPKCGVVYGKKVYERLARWFADGGTLGSRSGSGS